MLYNTRIFTATLGDKNFLVREKVFSNWEKKRLVGMSLEISLQFSTYSNLSFIKIG